MTHSATRCFNSATAVMPWKTHFAASGHRRRRRRLQFGHGGDAVENRESWAGDRKTLCFNSATAVMPWKTGLNAAAVAKAHELQFGHGGDAVENGRCSRKRPDHLPSFNSATAVMPWKTWLFPCGRKGSAPLQFGHGGDAVENLATNAGANPGVEASIRPRR